MNAVRQLRQFRAAVAVFSRQPCALAAALFLAAIAGDDAHTRYGGLLVPAVSAALAPVVGAVLFGLTWVVLLALGVRPADDDPAQQ